MISNIRPIKDLQAILLLLAIFVAFCSISLAQEEDEDPKASVKIEENIPKTAEEVKIKTPVYLVNSDNFEPPLGRYVYTVGWSGIPAAEATITVEQEGLNLKISSTAKTYRGIDILYKLRYRASGILSLIDYTPISSEVEHRENSKTKLTDIKFESDGSIKGSRVTVGKTPVTFDFRPENVTLDPFAASMLARGSDWSLGEEKQFDVFNGKSRYLITLKAVSEERIEVNNTERDVWVISPTVKNLINPKQSAKLREAKIYLTKDKAREILKISSEVFVGSVNSELIRFEPSENPLQVYRASYLTGEVSVH